MYEYPEYNTPRFNSSIQNPRGNPGVGYSPTTPSYTAMSGAYDNASYAPQTIGEFNYSNNEPFSLGFEQEGWRSNVGDWFESRLPNTSGNLNKLSNGLDNVGNQVGAGIDAMSFGDKAMAAGGVAKGLFDAYNSYKTNKLAKEQFNFTKMNTNRNFQASANSTNAALSDRQAARVARNPNQFASVSEYMNKYGVKV
jgi:hypothetical protein